jgi:hypothetical protein
MLVSILGVGFVAHACPNILRPDNFLQQSPLSDAQEDRNAPSISDRLWCKLRTVIEYSGLFRELRTGGEQAERV